MIVSVYDDTGQFTLQCELGDGETPDIPTGGGYVEGAINGDIYYVVGGVLTPRPSLLSDFDFLVDADGVDEVSFSIPANTVVNHEGKTYFSSADELFVFKSSILGEWEFEILPPFPYIQNDIKVTAIAV